MRITSETSGEYRPVLDGRVLGGSGSERIQLAALVSNAEAIVRSASSRLQHHHAQFESLAKHQDPEQLVAVMAQCGSHLALMKTLMQRLEQLITKVRAENEDKSRRLYIDMTASAMHTTDDESSAAAAATAGMSRLQLCPLTPAEEWRARDQQQALLQSLEKIPLHRLSSLAADSARSTARKKKQQYMEDSEMSSVSSEKLVYKRSMDAHAHLLTVTRQLQYEEDDDEFKEEEEEDEDDDDDQDDDDNDAEEMEF